MIDRTTILALAATGASRLLAEVTTGDHDLLGAASNLTATGAIIFLVVWLVMKGLPKIIDDLKAERAADRAEHKAEMAKAWEVVEQLRREREHERDRVVCQYGIKVVMALCFVLLAGQVFAGEIRVYRNRDIKQPIAPIPYAENDSSRGKALWTYHDTLKQPRDWVDLDPGTFDLDTRKGRHGGSGFSRQFDWPQGVLATANRGRATITNDALDNKFNWTWTGQGNEFRGITFEIKGNPVSNQWNSYYYSFANLGHYGGVKFSRCWFFGPSECVSLWGGDGAQLVEFEDCYGKGGWWVLAGWSANVYAKPENYRFKYNNCEWVADTSFRAHSLETNPAPLWGRSVQFEGTNSRHVAISACTTCHPRAGSRAHGIELTDFRQPAKGEKYWGRAKISDSSFYDQPGSLDRARANAQGPD